MIVYSSALNAEQDVVPFLLEHLALFFLIVHAVALRQLHKRQRKSSHTRTTLMNI